MKINVFIKLLLFLFISSLLFTGCKEKKEHPMVDIESIDYNGSLDEKYIFREELKKEQEKKDREKKYRKNDTE